MHILHISTALEKKFGGPPKAVVGITCALADIGEEMSVFIFGQTDASVIDNADFFKKLKMHLVSFYVAKSRRISIYGGIESFRDLGKLNKVIGQVDLVTIHAIYNFQNVIVPLICIINRKPFVVMPHGTLTSYQTRIHMIRKILPNLYFVNIMLTLASRIFVATQVELEELPRWVQNKTIVVGLGVEPPISSICNERKRENFRFLFMGRIAPKKRLELALESFALFRKSYNRDSRFIICGDGEQSYVNSIRLFALELGVSDFLDFRGWVNDDEKESIWRTTDCFVLTSSDENFAIAVAEALSFGIPCLLSEKVALSSIVKKYDAGIVFEEYSAILIAEDMIRLANSDLEDYSDGAIRASKELEWKFVAKKWQSEFARHFG